ncbi:glucuronate isomerase [Daejeonella sp.]|uniref:glucuronate isomerase n=1 Tax=Daejeonella sp. TaxID=2805397 RepID=UPI0030BA5B0D
MKNFLDDDFLLTTDTAKTLYHSFAKGLPIIDYHCHLPPDQIAEDLNFKNLTQIWLYGDHYKWRAMRANGIPEEYITGDRSDYEKFEKWAETVPYTIRNPLYHWTHLELRRYFDVYDILSPATAKKIYDECSEKLQTPEYSVRNLMRKMKVEMTGTTDDPLDDLAYHQKIKKDGFEIKVLPSFRPDKAMAADNIQALNEYIQKLEGLSKTRILNFGDYLSALKGRHNYFAENGCSVSDHGLEQFYAEDYTDAEIDLIFKSILSNEPLSHNQVLKFKSCMLFNLGLWDHEKGWVQQYHVGGLRNNNTRLLSKIGADAGLDSIGDFSQGVAMTRFLNKLDMQDRLAKTIIYNLNPVDNELIAAMTGNFNDGTVAGKVQFGSAWWFLDQKDGMIKQLNALSNIGLLSRFVGMLTDSRSFLSYPRHEYFRRILCDLIGKDVENGELPDDIEWLGKIVKDVCYYNAKAYFNFN